MTKAKVTQFNIMDGISIIDNFRINAAHKFCIKFDVDQTITNKNEILF